MLPHRASSIILLLLVSTACGGQERGGVRATVALPVVMGVLDKAHVVGSLAYWGHCKYDDHLPDFPRLRAAKSGVESPVQALREIFSDDSEMRVTQEPDGTIRMAETNVPRDLLEVRISYISFKATYDDSWGVPYDSRFALAAILRAPEVRAFMKANQIGSKDEFSTVIGGGQSPVHSHIPGDLYDVTLAQALDHVLKTFPGLWVYENCFDDKGKRLALFKFF